MQIPSEQKITLILGLELITSLKVEAAQRRVSVSKLCRNLLDAWVKQAEAERQQTNLQACHITAGE